MINYSIITCIMDDYEIVHEVLCPQDNVEYILVTDNKDLKSDTWKVVYEPLLDTDRINGIAKSFFVKYNAYKYVSNEYFIRLDAKFSIVDSFDDIILNMLENNYDMIVFQHAYTYSVYEEYENWEMYRLQNTEFKMRFFQKMKNYDFDPNWKGLFGTTIQFCKKTEYVELFFDDMRESVITFRNGGVECDNNDLCYMTLFLMGKYHNKINTNVISWTICQSKWLVSNTHRTNTVDTTYDYAYDTHLHWYWRGEDMGELEDLMCHRG